MSVELDHPEVERFLARLDDAAAALPPARREELLAEIREHLREALAATGPSGGHGAARDAAVRQALDRLGDPADIVAAEGADADGSGTGETAGTTAVAGRAPSGTAPGESPWGGLEVVAVLLLGLSGVVVPLLGVLLGLVLLHRSTAWTRRTRRVATVVATSPLLLGPFFWGLSMLVDRTTGGGDLGFRLADRIWSTALLPHPAEGFFLALVLQPFFAAAAAVLLALRIRRSAEPGLALETLRG